MKIARFSGIPGRRASADVLDTFSPKFIFVPLFIIFAAACLVIAGCTDEEVVAPINGDDEPDDPVCPLNSPWVEIVSPDVGDAVYYPPRITFSWEQDPVYMIAYTRYLVTKLEPGETGTDLLNEHPELFDNLWTEWKRWDPAGESAVVGEDGPLDSNGIHFFAVQALDSCGKETDHFDELYNARQFAVKTIYPSLYLEEPMLGKNVFTGVEQYTPVALVLPGLDFEFIWHAEPGYSWFGPIEYRYGWDIQNLDDDDEWTDWDSRRLSSWPPFNTSAGVHVIYVEARDDAGTTTRARVELEAILYTRDRDLLWVDDFLLGDVILPMRHLPTETEHDEFWTGICSIAPGFDPARDIYEADRLSGNAPLPLEVLARYRSVIWTYDRTSDNSWSNTIEFELNDSPTFPRPNNLRMFLAAGGKTLTCGMGDSGGSAMSATFKYDPLFPASLKDDMGDSWADLTFAENSMAYADYSISVIDKVVAQFKTGFDLPGGVTRDINMDAMRMALVTDEYASVLPDTLILWDEITEPGMFFDPMDKGFTYVEVYDPAYYMDFRGMWSQGCFSPFYLMRARSTRSALDYSAVALRTTLYGCDDPEQLLPAESFHFGLPLWFMDHGQVEQIADYIFREWGIR